VIGAASLAAVAALLAFGFHRLPGELRDIEVYWTAASRALHAEPLYRASDGHYQFKYLPAFAVMFAPAALLPLQTAKALWFVVSAALLPLLIGLAIGLIPELRRPRWLLASVAVIVMGKFFGHELVLGQVNILFAVIVCAGVLMMRLDRDTSAAVLFVAGMAVKPYAVVFLAWITLIRRSRTALPSTVALAALLLLPAILYGVPRTIELHHEWWTTVTASTAPNLTNNDNVSLAGMYAKWLGAGRTASLATLMSSLALLAVVAVSIARRQRVAGAEALEGALLLTLIPLLSPQGWDYVFLVATPAVVLFANYDDGLPAFLRWTTRAALAVIGLSLFDVMGRQHYATFMSWSVITWCFIWLAMALAAIRLHRVA
jgi:alpha-1,2-mannosyltransferase